MASFGVTPRRVERANGTEGAKLTTSEWSSAFVMAPVVGFRVHGFRAWLGV